MESSKESSGIDKQGLWGWWHDSLQWKDKLQKRAVHKALDIPESEEMQNVGNKIGMGWKELAVIGAILLGGYGSYNYFNSETTTQQPQAATSQGAGPVDSEYEVRFYDAGGNPVQVPHISARPADE